MKRQHASWMAVGLGLSVCGCQYSLPAGFVKVDPSWDTHYRAVSADGAAITLRTQENPENGDLVFWEKAVQARLVDYRGYKLVERREVTHGGRTPGVEMVFDYERDGIAYTYLLRLVVKGRQVHCIEVAGEKNSINSQMPAILSAVDKWPL